jgi:GNAT superfamily N-acetyltransferase
VSLLWVTAAQQYRFHHFQDDEEPWDDDDPQRHWVTAEHVPTGKTVGQARYYHASDGKSVRLDGDIFVEPEHRRRGVASGMMRHLRDLHNKPVDPVDFTPSGLELWRSLGWDGFGR